jgi:hypothetical protein
MDHVRRVITLGVKSRGERQYVRGTELYAESAGLTALDYDLHRTFGHLLPFLLGALPKEIAALAADLPFKLGVAPGITLRLGRLIHLPNDGSIFH